MLLYSLKNLLVLLSFFLHSFLHPSSSQQFSFPTILTPVQMFQMWKMTYDQSHLSHYGLWMLPATEIQSNSLYTHCLNEKYQYLNELMQMLLLLHIQTVKSKKSMWSHCSLPEGSRTGPSSVSKSNHTLLETHTVSTAQRFLEQSGTL